MPTPQVVSAKDVLRATQHLRRRGLLAMIRDMESVEPDLAGRIDRRPREGPESLLNGATPTKAPRLVGRPGPVRSGRPGAWR